MGLFGAYSADFVHNTFGLALIIFLVVPILWGMALCRYHTLVEYKIRIFAWLVGILSLSAFLNLAFREYLIPYDLVGDWSVVVSRPLNTYINMLNFSYNTLILEGIVLFMAMLSFNLSAGITFKRWSKFFTGIWNIGKKIISVVVRICKKVVRIREFKEFQEVNPSYLQTRLRKSNDYRAEPKLESLPIEKAPEIEQVQIEIPQAQNNAKPTVNPTFSFMAQSDAENKDKPKHKKILPEEIYQTEGLKSFFPKLKMTKKDIETEN